MTTIHTPQDLPAEIGDTYWIYNTVYGRAIRCTKCGLTSYHPKDVEHRYCGNCHKFHKPRDHNED